MQSVRRVRIAAALSIAVAGSAAIAEDAPTGIKRTPLQSIDFPDGYKTVTGLAEILPGDASGMHTHPGIETGYMLEGEVLMIDRGPTRPDPEGRRFLRHPGGREARREEHRQRAGQGDQRVRDRQDKAAGEPGEVAPTPTLPLAGRVANDVSGVGVETQRST